ncbi:MAG: TonB family protein, partial [Pseudoxanthomonas sp.]
LLWFAGAGAAALAFHRMQRRYLRKLGSLTAAGDGVYVSMAGTCPAVVGAWKARIVLPADFDARYPAREGEMVLAHERAHLRRGDAMVNLVVVVLRSVHWFNPLLHWAAPRFRQDQEMACDAMVLGQFPDRRRSYAEAMLKTQLAVLGLPVGCHWQSSQSLKERILMLKQPLPGRRRLRAGIVTVGIVACLAAYTAWALQPGGTVKGPAMVGMVVEEAVAMANVVVQGDRSQVEMSSGAMASGPDGSTDIFLVPRFPFNASVGRGEGRWALEASVTNGASPVVSWTLSHAGRVVQQSKAPLQDGRPLLLQVGEDGVGATRLLVSFSQVPGDKVMRVAGADDPAKNGQAQPDHDGAYRYAHASASYGPAHAMDGEALLLLSLDAEGRVSDVEIEQVEPAGALTLDQARLQVRDQRYSPKIENGRAVRSSIRMPLVFGPMPPSNAGSTGTEEALTFSGNVITRPAQPARDAVPDSPVAIKDAPPPAYPTEALSRKQDGKVVLIVDVGADGSVTDARIDTSNPPTVFDAAALDAVKKWKFTPAMEQGRAVPAKVQIPVTFEADAGAGGAANGPVSGRQYAWHRNAADPPIRETACDVMRVRQDGETGDISSMECGISAATAGK